MMAFHTAASAYCFTVDAVQDKYKQYSSVCLQMSSQLCVGYLKESMGALKFCRGKTIAGLELTGRASLLFRYMSFSQ